MIFGARREISSPSNQFKPPVFCKKRQTICMLDLFLEWSSHRGLDGISSPGDRPPTGPVLWCRSVLERGKVLRKHYSLADSFLRQFLPPDLPSRRITRRPCLVSMSSSPEAGIVKAVASLILVAKVSQ